MTTHIGQDCLLQRRAKIPHSSQNTAGFCSPPPTGAGFSPPALSVSVNQSIPHPQAAPAAGPCANHAVIHSSGLGTHLPTVTPSRCWGHSRSRSQGCAQAPASLAQGAGILSWREDERAEGKEKRQSRAGTICKRLQDHATSSLLCCHCNGLGSSMLLLLSFNVIFHYFLNL